MILTSVMLYSRIHTEFLWLSIWADWPDISGFGVMKFYMCLYSTSDYISFDKRFKNKIANSSDYISDLVKDGLTRF